MNTIGTDKAARSRRYSTRTGLVVLIVLLSSTLLFGCAQIRKVTYPRNFVYLEHTDITSKMFLLSLYIHQIDQLLSAQPALSSDERLQLIETLSLIAETTESLGSGNILTNHLVIDDQIDQFRQGVTTALDDARAEPPNYYAAGQLSGNCNACHRLR